MSGAHSEKPGGSDEDVVKRYGRLVREHYTDQVAARYRTAANSDFPFYERLVHFWTNHFAGIGGQATDAGRRRST